MKRLLAITALLALPLGCVANQGTASVRFLSTRGIKAGNDCTTDTTVYVTSGRLDLAGGSSYLLAMNVETNTNVRDISIGQVNFQGNGLNDITIYEIVYSYDFSDAASTGITLPKEESVPFYVVLRPQSDPNQNPLGVLSIGPKALELLQTYYRAHPGATGTVVSHIKGKAYLSGSQETETNIFSFPTTVYASTDFDYSTGKCTGGKVLLTRCGRPGQDADVCVAAGG